jgi:germination protein M
VLQPQAGQRVRSPIVVSGTAVVYEASVAAALVDPSGRRLAEGFTTALAGAPERGTFQLTLSFPPPSSEMPATLWVYSHSPRDGSIINLVTVPLVLLPR